MPKLKGVIQSHWDSGGFIALGAGGNVRSFHHASLLDGRDRALVATSHRRYATFKEVSLNGLVRRMKPPTTRSKSERMIPTIADFVEWRNEEDKPLKEVSVKHGRDPVDKLKDWPCSLWVNPWHLVNYYDKPRKAGDIARSMCDLFYKSSLPDDEMERLNDRLYYQLVYLWACDMGLVHTTSLYDVGDTEDVDECIENTHNLLLNADRWKSMRTKRGDTNINQPDKAGDNRVIHIEEEEEEEEGTHEDYQFNTEQAEIQLGGPESPKDDANAEQPGRRDNDYDWGEDQPHESKEELADQDSSDESIQVNKRRQSWDNRHRDGNSRGSRRADRNRSRSRRRGEKGENKKRKRSRQDDAKAQTGYKNRRSESNGTLQGADELVTTLV